MMILSKSRLGLQIVVLCILFIMSMRISYGQSDSSELPVKLKSLLITQKIDLNKIFRPLKETAQEKTINVSSFEREKLPSLELVGTLILGEQKFAWIKIDDIVYQLEPGQVLPGMQTQISKINPDTVVLKNDETCQNSNQCERTLSIRDTLF